MAGASEILHSVNVIKCFELQDGDIYCDAIPEAVLSHIIYKSTE